jgi:sugar phosphate isomerase/epimerase
MKRDQVPSASSNSARRALWCYNNPVFLIPSMPYGLSSVALVRIRYHQADLSSSKRGNAMHAKFACADFTFPLLPHENVLRLIAMLEFTGVDIGLFENRSHLWPSQEFAQLSQAAQRLKHQLDANGLVAADVFLQLDPTFAPYAINHPEAMRRQYARVQFAHTLEYAAQVGARHVTTLPGVEFDGEPPAEAWQRAVEELHWRVEQARQFGIIFGVEPHVGSIVPHPQRTAELVAQVPGLTLTLDYTHFIRLGMADAEVEPLVALASHFHVRGARPGRLQTAFKDNAIDYGRVLHVMREAGYSGWLGIEYTWSDWEHCNECDNISETILFRDYLRDLME